MELYKFGKNQALSKYEYTQTQLKLACLLRPELKDPLNYEELKRILDQDWKHDTQGKNYMDQETLESALFELADIWTAGLQKDEYKK